MTYIELETRIFTLPLLGIIRWNVRVFLHHGRDDAIETNYHLVLSVIGMKWLCRNSIGPNEGNDQKCPRWLHFKGNDIGNFCLRWQRWRNCRTRKDVCDERSSQLQKVLNSCHIRASWWNSSVSCLFFFWADEQRPLVEQPCEDKLDPWGCSFHIVFGSKGCNSEKIANDCRYSCNLCEMTLFLF